MTGGGVNIKRGGVQCSYSISLLITRAGTPGDSQKDDSRIIIVRGKGGNRSTGS